MGKKNRCRGQSPYLPGGVSLLRAGPYLDEVRTQGSDIDGNRQPTSPWGTRIQDYLPVRRGAAGERMLYRLCSIRLSSAEVIRIRRLRTLILIGGVSTFAGGVFLAREVVSPGWHFSDGSVCFGLRIERSPCEAVDEIPFEAPAFENGTTLFYGDSPGLIYDASALPAYRAPNNGIFPGDGLSDLGQFYDSFIPWNNCCDLDIPVEGPARVSLWASVLQTDPDTHVVPTPDSGSTNNPAIQSMDGWRPEDQFLVSVPEAEYVGVSGAIGFQSFRRTFGCG